ncbi:carbohydrate-binding protein [Flavobacterium sp. UMI-01]|uniref:carbohydrate-binding protein n=1 Tax=Flavobacterium sp. UMI-01 TaxID=1441053 RepID=UPI001C7D5C8E|nr:carbohydrate-binding protein [Flavobacterium sp. UMI-01]
MNHLRIQKRLSLKGGQLYYLFLLLCLTISVQAQMVHPGLSHKKSDLDRMKYMVQAKIEPYYSSYIDMIGKTQASYNYQVLGNPSLKEIYRDAPKTNLTIFESDSRAAYYNALRWYIEGDERHAQKAVECLNAWTGLTYVQYNGTAALTSNVIIIMLEAAELIKSTYPGWTATDIQKFKDMLVYPGYSNTTIPSNLSTDGTWYWRAYKFDPVRAGNQELCGIRTTMAIGVFLDDERIYDRAWRYINMMPGREDDIPFPKGPHVQTTVIDENKYRIAYNMTELATEPNFYGNGALTNYVWENGQCQESSRDQGHTAFGLGVLSSIAEIAWNQGDDLWGKVNNRILLGLEYTLKYNVSYVKSYPDQTTPWEPTAASGEFIQRNDATLRTKSLAICPVVDNCETCLTRGTFKNEDTWELPIAHYIGRGLNNPEDAKWTIRARDYSIVANGRYETGPSGGAYVGFGGLSFRRPDYCFGDPIRGFDSSGLPNYAMNVLPMTIEAENFDYFVTDGENRTYYDTTPVNSGGTYRLNEHVDIKACSEGGNAITNIASGEWLTYTVSVPSNGTYDIAIRYAAANGNGKIKFNFGGTDVTTEVAVPFGASHSTSLTDWKDFFVIRGVRLSKGVQAMKVLFSGADSSFELNTISVALVQADPEEVKPELVGRIQAEDYEKMFGIQTETTKDVDGGLNVGWIHNGDWAMYPNVRLTGTSVLEVRVAGTNTGNIQVRLGSETGTLIGTVPITSTGNSQKWQTKSINITETNGAHDVYLVFTGGSGYLFNINWFEFKNPNLATTDFDTEYSRIRIHPNPVQNTLSVVAPASEFNQYTIFDSSGKITLKGKITTAQETENIDVTNLSKGLYFISLEGRKTKKKFKFIKN